MNKPHSYYGRLDQPASKKTFGIYFMDDLIKKIMDKHEARLMKDQRLLLDRFSKNITEELNITLNSVKELNDEIKRFKKEFEALKPKESISVIPKEMKSKKNDRNTLTFIRDKPNDG